MKVLRYRKATDIDVQFEDGTIVEHRNYYNFLKGRIKESELQTEISHNQKEKDTAILDNVLLFFRYSVVFSDLQCGQSSVCRVGLHGVHMDVMEVGPHHISKGCPHGDSRGSL
jgi:hypothetical protein